MLNQAQILFTLAESVDLAYLEKRIKEEGSESIVLTD
jgi:hypothetical protein